MKRTLLAGLLFVASLPLVSTRIRGADEIEYFSTLRSAVFDRDLEFGNEYQHFYDADPQGLAGFKATFLDLREPATGRHINFGPVGAAVLWSPFYLAAHGGVLAARLFGMDVAADGFSRPYVAAVCYASAFYALCGLLIVDATLRRTAGVARAAAAWSTTATLLATPLLYYVLIAPAFAHACSFFSVALLVFLSLRAFLRADATLLDWAACGAAAGLCALVREQDGLFIVFPMVLLGARGLGDRRLVRAAVAACVVGGTALAVFLPQIAAYRVVNGSFGPTKLVTRKMSYGSPHFLGVLFDPAHGLFLWSPFCLVAAIGLLAWVARRWSALPLACAAALLLQVWINGSVLSWTQAGAFGARRFVSVLPLLAFGAAFVFDGLVRRERRVAAGAIAVVCAWWNVSLMVQFGLKLMDRQGLDWPRVAVNQVLEVPPRLARTAWLFLTDRERLVREGGS